MKKLSLLILLFSFTNLFAQKSDNETGVILASDFQVTRPIRDIFRENPVDENYVHVKKESGDRKHRVAQKFVFGPKDGPQYGNDPSVVQTQMGNIVGNPPKANWAGQTASGFRPYDPSGAVGPNHYVQMINSTTFRIYNKTLGTAILTGTLGNLWSPATANNGDPIVLYDKAADRWFLAQFGNSTDKRIYIAVSQTNDPTGAYYTYTYTSPLFPDYLKFGVWADGYYMTSNQSTQKVFCFNRAEMLAGTPSARSIYINYTPPKSGFFCPLPGDAGDGTLPAYGTPCPIISYSDNGWGTSFSDAVNIYNMSVNWVPTTPTATITLATAIPTAAFDASYEPSWNDVSQPGTTQKLDAIGGVCMYRAQWKTWSGYNSIVLNWSVKSSATQRSIKWCEIRQNQTTGTWTMYQEGIYTPDAATRWMGSMAMDNNGSIGLSYLKSDATSIYPGLYYTGRRICDPLGTLPVTEVLVEAGTGYQTGTNRVGDYAHTTLDVDGITFWSTSEYMGGSSGSSAARTRIFSYQINPCGNNASVSIVQSAGTNPSCPGNSVTFTASPFNGGTSPSYQWKINGANVGTNSPTYTSTSITNGQIITCVMTSNLVGVAGSPATSNAITLSVNPTSTPTVNIALTGGSNPSCPGVAITFTATATNAGASPTYQWKINGSNVGTNSATYSSASITNGQIVSCTITSNALCATTTTANSNSITLTINSNPTPSVTIAQTSGSNPFCLGSSIGFTATASNAASPSYQWQVNGANVGTNSSTFSSSSLTNGQIVTCLINANAACPNIATLGTGTSLNSTTSGLAAAYASYYGNGRQQYLLRASELTALGLTAGNIQSIAFNVAGTTGNPSTLNSYQLKMAATTSSVMASAFQNPSFTTVFGPVNYTPVLNSWNTHTFSTPFTWNGTSNILIDICFSNSVVGTVAYQNYQTSTSFVSTVYYQADGSGGAGACSTSTVTNTGSIRPNMILTKASGTTNATSNSITMIASTSITPTINIAQTTGSNPLCSGATAIFTATVTNGGSTPSYQWKINGGNVGTNSSTFTTTGLTNGQTISCVLTSNAACANPTTATSNIITMAVNNPTTNGSSTQTACNSYTWNGTTYTTSGVYTFTSLNGNGCLNTATLNLTINPSTTNGSSTQTACNSYTWNGTTYTTSGVYTFTSLNGNGCLNTATLNLTINPSTTNGSSTQTACNSYTWNGTTYTTSGVYTFTSLNGNGCLNAATLNLTINPSTTNGSSTQTACDSYTWNGTTYTTSGVYTFTSLNGNGCLNTATLNLTINPSTTNGSSTQTACNSYTWNGTTYTTSGVYTFTSLNGNGCLNTATLNLTINPSTTNGSSTQTACNSYTWNGTTYTTSGVYTFTSLNGNGCLNAATLNLTINPSTTNGSSTQTACNSYTWNGTTYTTSGVYTFTSLNGNGCLNTATLNLTINPSTTNGSSTQTACNSYTWNGTTYTTSGVYTFTSLNGNGCLNTATLNLTINPSTTNGSSTQTACNSYTWNGTTYTTSGVYTFTSLNGNGCLNTATLNLTINPSTTNGSSTQTACNSYTWNGTTYTTSGLYTFTSLNGNGCLNTATLNLTINSTTSSNQTISMSNSYFWSANNNTYTNSGIYTHTLLNATGCDSILTLNLTIVGSATGLQVSIKVLLMGPFDAISGLMHDSLRVNGLIPTIEPYSNSPFNAPQLGYPGGESISASILNNSGSNAIIDWVLIELRAASNPTTIIATKRALLQRDGDVVSHADGVSPIIFPNETQGNYYVTLKHRNHLGVMSATPVYLTSTNSIIDFTLANTVWENPLITTNTARKPIGSIFLLWNGDANANKNVKYNGFSSDKDAVLNTVGASNFNGSVFGYRVEDLNMDTKVRYNSLNNDRNLILTTVGANTPNKILSQHTPN